MVTAYFTGHDSSGEFVDGIRIGSTLRDVAVALEGEGIAVTYCARDTGEKVLAQQIQALNPFNAMKLRRARLGFYRLCAQYTRSDLGIDLAAATYLRRCPHAMLKTQLRTFLRARERKGTGIAEVLETLSCFPVRPRRDDLRD